MLVFFVNTPFSMSIRNIPSWISCQPSHSSSAVWSMAVSEAEAVRAMVLAMSVQVVSAI